MPRANPNGTETITLVTEGQVDQAGLGKTQMAWAEANGFRGQLGKVLALPGTTGARTGYLFGMGPEEGRPVFATGLLSTGLEPGTYELQGALGDATSAALGFLLGTYKYRRFKPSEERVELLAPQCADMAEARRLADAAFLARDLVNTPPNILGPDAFEVEIRAFARARKMTVSAIVGDDLLKKHFPMIHAVGRASVEAPRLLDLAWGRKSDPKITLVGKGVTFDTGGLDIKPPSGMALMKKDMGGAANVLGLAHAIVDAKLKVRLRVLIPVVENAISGSAFRPGDVLPSRAGLNVEIGNTDAEGRLILADALTLADEESPELVVDMATLTGAARVALGPELVPLYATSDALAASVCEAGRKWDDPMWHMPLWDPYDRLLSSSIADVNHISSGSYAGSVTAALFLRRFVKQAKEWAHLDIFAWAPEARAGRSAGGTDQGIRALYEVLKTRYPA